MAKHKPVESIAIVGAGMAGITCAISLSVEIPKVTVFEEKPVAGGRMASLKDGDYEFDYGAQFFSVGSEEFEQRVQAWKDEWLLDLWDAWVVDLQQSKALSRDLDVSRYVCRPTMDSLLIHLAALCEVDYNKVIQKLDRKGDAWYLYDQANQAYGPYDVVVLALPAPLAARLIVKDRKLAKQVKSVQMTSCWAVVLGFSEALDLGYDAAHIVDSPITWIGRNNSKPERKAQECWVIHALGEWSDQHADLDAASVTRKLFEAFKQVTGANIHMPAYAKAFYWPYALAANALHGDSLYNARIGLGACGDWCVSPRVEGAFLSGLSMAQRILAGDDA